MSEIMDQLAREAVRPGSDYALLFEKLSARQRDQAAAHFFNAGPADGFLYYVCSDGSVLSRRRIIQAHADTNGVPPPSPA